MCWFLILVAALSVCTSGYSTKKMIKIVNEPANYGGLQSYQSSHPEAKVRPEASRNEEQFSGPLHLRVLSGKCFSLPDNTYKYELCPFFNITQHEQTWRWNAFHGILGVWKEWSIVNNTFEAMVMNDGDECPGHTRRRSKVFFKCGDNDVLESVKEPSTCSYEVIFQTPLACPLDAFLVYPVLSSEAQREWENIEESFYHDELTVQGYNNKRDNLFVRAGLKILENTKDVPDFAVPNSSSAKTEFLTKDQCQQAYSKLLHKYLELHDLLTKQNVSTTQNIKLPVNKVDTRNASSLKLGERTHKRGNIDTTWENRSQIRN